MKNVVRQNCFTTVNSGEMIEATLYVNRLILSDAIEAFENNISIDPAKDTINCLTIHVKGSSDYIINWLFKYHGNSKIIEPQSLRDEYFSILSSALIFNKTRSELGYYRKQIKEAKETYRLFMRDIFLDKYKSYKRLKNVTSVYLRNNWITDFSFLQNYPELVELTIIDNTIQDAQILSTLKNLEDLSLVDTGIINLDFLVGLNNLKVLCLGEESLENVDPVYSIKRLESLMVNQSTSELIDKKRLRKAYGKEFVYYIDGYLVLD